MQHFHEISPLDITDNFIRAIGQEWMLITAGDASRCNTGDKFAASGLTVVRTDAGTPAVGEARLVLECRKMYVGRFEAEGFLQKELLERMYPDHDLHYCYIVQIEHVFVRDGE